MNETAPASRFRTALHGFNREDVVAYIEKSTQEHDRALQGLQDSVSRLRRELAEKDARIAELSEALAREQQSAVSPEALEQARQEIGSLKERLSEGASENEALREQNASLTEKTAALQARLSALEDELSDLRQEAAEAAKPVEAAPEEAPAEELDAPLPAVEDIVPVQPVKDYTELELAAYRRAELTERLARERATDIYKQVQSVFNTANTRFDSGKADLDQLIKTLQLDVNQLMSLLANIRSAYSDCELSFEAVSAKNRELIDASL